MGTLRCSEIFSNTTCRVIAVETVNFEHSGAGTFRAMVGNIAPVAIIVCQPDGTTAFDMDANLADLALLRRDVSGLDASIAAYEHARSITKEWNGNVR